MTTPSNDRPSHPFWCDECGGKAPFRIKGSVINHEEECARFGETEAQAMALHEKAVAWLRANPGQTIP